MNCVTVLWLLLMVVDVSWAQRGKPLVMDAFRNGVYTFHTGQIIIRARCAYTEVVGSDVAKPVLGKCSDHHGPFELPGDTVSAFQWESESTRGTTRNDTTYETFPNGDLDVSELHSWNCIDGLPQCSHYRIVISHFKVVDMKREDRFTKSKGKGRRDFSQRPLFMPATTYAPTHLAQRGLT